MRKIFLIFFGILTVVFLAVTWPFVKAAFLAFTFAVIFFPLYRFALRKLRLHRYIAAIVTTFIIAICVILPLVTLGTVVITRIGHFLQGFASATDGGTFSDTISPLITWVHGWLERIVGSAPSVEDLQGAVLAVFKEAGRKFYELSPRVLSTTVSLVVNFLLMFVFLVVLFVEGGRLHDWLMETAPISAEYRSELSRGVRLMLTSSIVAALLTALVQGSLLGLGFWIVGFDQPYGWCLVAIILSIIPIIGAASCYITATAVLLSKGNAHAAILFLAFGVAIVSSVDNVIRPLIMRGTSHIHPLLLFVTLVGSVKLFGPIGLLVGPVLLSIFLSSIRIYRREFVKIEGER